MTATARGLYDQLEGVADPVALFRRATGYEPQPWQPEYLEEVRNAILLKGRQIGASTCTGFKAVRMARAIPWFTACVVSPSLKQSKEVKDRAKQSLERLGVELVTDSASELTLRNHSRIVSLPGSKKSVRGYTADFLVIDEAAFLEEETFLAARALAATGGRVVVQSTPAGPFGHFYKLWMALESGWAKYEVRSDEVDTISPEFLATERATLTAEEYAQEYEASFGNPGMGLVSPERLALMTLKDEGAKSPFAAVRR